MKFNGKFPIRDKGDDYEKSEAKIFITIFYN